MLARASIRMLVSRSKLYLAFSIYPSVYRPRRKDEGKAYGITDPLGHVTTDGDTRRRGDLDTGRQTSSLDIRVHTQACSSIELEVAIGSRSVDSEVGSQGEAEGDSQLNVG